MEIQRKIQTERARRRAQIKIRLRILKSQDETLMMLQRIGKRGMIDRTKMTMKTRIQRKIGTGKVRRKARIEIRPKMQRSHDVTIRTLPQTENTRKVQTTRRPSKRAMLRQPQRGDLAKVSVTKMRLIRMTRNPLINKRIVMTTKSRLMTGMRKEVKRTRNENPSENQISTNGIKEIRRPKWRKQKQGKIQREPRRRRVLMRQTNHLSKRLNNPNMDHDLRVSKRMLCPQDLHLLTNPV